jgi:hypothetical protein
MSQLTLQTFSFSLALQFTRELAFGVLAIAGCVVVQCLILFWILLAKLQLHFVLVQERMLREVYEQTNESLPSADKEMTTTTESIPDVTISAAHSTLTPPTVVTTDSQLSPQAQAFELPDAIAASPRPTSPAEAPVWQTKALTARKTGGKRSYAVKQVDSLAPSIPPGFGPLKPASETVKKSAEVPSEGAVRLSASALPFSLSPDWDTGTSEAALDPFAGAFDLSPDAAQFSQLGGWNPDASAMPETPASDSIQLSANALPFSFSPDWTPGVLEAEALYAMRPTRPAVRPPPGLPSSPKYNENNQPRPLSEHVTSVPSVVEPMMHNGPAGTIRRARRPVIKKVQSAEDQGTLYKMLWCLFTDESVEVETSKDVSPVSPEVVAHHPKNVTTGFDRSQIKPATLDELQHKFVDTTMLRNRPDDWPEDPTPAHAAPLDPEHAARVALAIALSERETTRVQLNTNYSHDCALRFDEKAKAYKMRRRELAALMPSGQLNREDVESFPYLSAKDTLEPTVRCNILTFS